MCPESLTLKRGHTGTYEEVGGLGGESGEPETTQALEKSLWLEKRGTL